MLCFYSKIFSASFYIIITIIIIIVIIILLFNRQSLYHCRLAGSQNSTGLTSSKNSAIMWHVLIITAFCDRMFTFSLNLFGMIAVVDNTTIIRYYVGRFHFQNSYNLVLQVRIGLLLEEIIIIIIILYYYYYYTIRMSLVTGLFFLVLLLNQR